MAGQIQQRSRVFSRGWAGFLEGFKRVQEGFRLQVLRVLRVSFLLPHGISAIKSLSRPSQVMENVSHIFNKHAIHHCLRCICGKNVSELTVKVSAKSLIIFIAARDFGYKDVLKSNDRLAADSINSLFISTYNVFAVKMCQSRPPKLR